MPQRSGLEVLQTLREQSFAGKVILMTVHNEEDFFNEALRLGANGYVLKDSAAQDVLSAIHAVSAGQNYVSPALMNLLFKQKQPISPAQTSDLDSLSPTERRILQMIAEYKTTNQIAELLLSAP